MQTVFVKHARRASLRPFASRATLAGALAALALSPAPSAWAGTTGGAPAATPASGATTPGGATTSGATASGGAAPTPLTRKPAIATWFGPGFYGSTTACGQKMSPTLVGVASRTLPCGTLVQVAYRGHRLTVPVLDRGPYGHIGAMWDLTAGAAHALDITETVRIRTQIVGSVANTPTLGEPAPGSEPASATSAPAATAATTGGAAAAG
jgi:rare lipoprotein A (peptidoglycan hydrolase)